MRDMTFGQYFPGKSVLHKMDPRMKLVLTILFIVLVFLPQNWWGVLLTVSFLGGVIALSRLPVKMLLKSVKPVLFLVVFTAALNVLYVHEGTTLWQWGFIHVTPGGSTTPPLLRCVS